MTPILNVVVVSFHHKRGCEVEYSYPKLTGPGEGGLPEQWSLLPSLALPDGVHNCEKDTIFFMLPSIEELGKSVFGVSCYRQIDANELLSKPDDVTRTSVQKSVCVVTKVPLFGPLKVKLELITQAYFEQRDFAKVDVLAQMYENLCDIFDNLSGQCFSELALHDISVQELFIRYRHRALLLFKLFLLERKVLFIGPNGLRIGETMLAIVSMFPKVLGEGLYFGSILLHENSARDEESSAKIQEDSGVIVIEEDVGVQLAKNDPIREKDSHGFPLSIYTQGSYFDPYLPIQCIDLIAKVRSCVVGATNALFSMKKDIFDVIVKIEEDGSLVHNYIEIFDVNLEKTVALTSADLRFADYILKRVEEKLKCSSADFDGSDEWIRSHMQTYLLGLVATSRSDLQTAIPHYGIPFVNEWRRTHNYRIWMSGKHDDLSCQPPGHAFSENLGVYDVYLRLEHAVNGVEGASKVFGSVNTAGKNLGNSIGETGNRVKTKFSNWWNRRGAPPAEGAIEAVEAVEEEQPSS